MHFTTQRRWTGSLFFTLCLWFLSATPAQAQVCDFEKRCGTACCQQGEVCYLGACIQEGTSCTENQDCASKEFCEATLKRCFPLSQTNLTCEYKPPVGKFAPKIAWEWRGGQIQPLSKNVMMTPVVMALQDTNNDNKIDAKDVPTVIFMSFEKGFTYADPGHLRAVRGDNGKPIFTNTTNTVNALGSLAVGDINNDGKPEIVAPRFSGTSGDPAGGMFAFKNDGTLLWTAKDQAGKIVPVRSGWGGASLADLDADGNPEVVVGSTVIRGSDGLVLCQGNKGNGSLANGAITSIVADLDNDGKQEIVTGKTAYRHDCTVMWDLNETDGFPAVADLTHNGQPEVVVIAPGELRVQEGKTGKVLMRITIPSVNKDARKRKRSGPPTIADLNGDGIPDITTAGFHEYYVYTTDAARKNLKLLWKFPIQDPSSGSTGSSIFDFEGDGKAEVLYNDEVFLRAFDGKTGNVLFSEQNPTGTALEYPIVVDVNNDGRSEIVTCSNDNTKIAIPNQPTLRVFSDSLDNWIGTRNVWNQHQYNVTNICTGDSFCPAGNTFGQIPKVPLQNWKVKGLNNFRQNVQLSTKNFQAADILTDKKSIQAFVDGCNGELRISAWVRNQGAKDIPKGLPISIYAQDTAQRTFLTTLQTTKQLAPGEAEFIEYKKTLQAPYPQSIVIAVDINDKNASTRNECNETNNTVVFRLPAIYCGEPPPQEPSVEPSTEPSSEPSVEPSTEPAAEPTQPDEPTSAPDKADASTQAEPTPDAAPDTTTIKDGEIGEKNPNTEEPSKPAPGCGCQASSSSVPLSLLFGFFALFGLFIRRKRTSA